MSWHRLIVASLLPCCLAWAGAARAADEYAEVRQEAVQRLAAFEARVAEARRAGVDVSRERVTITTAEIFLTYADWDAGHPSELQEAIAAWWRVRDRAAEIARDLPTKELREVIDVLRAAEDELAEAVERPSSRRVVPRVDSGALEMVGRYFHFDGQPTFPSSFVWMPGDERLQQAYGEIGGTYIALSNLRPDGTVSIRYQPQDRREPMGYVFFGHSGPPAWLRSKHPEIQTGSRHFTGYDIDHPATREAWRDLLAVAVPRFAGRKISQGGYLLANEPHWFTGTGQWDTGTVSNFTHEKFRRWLAAEHGSIDVLNRLWGTQFSSFDDVALDVPVDTELRGTAVWYDWCRFNMYRVTDWFSFLKSEIRRHDPAAKTHIKLIPGHFAQGLRSHGLDFESLVRLQDILGCDAKIVNSSNGRVDAEWTDRYACDWRNLAMPYDFFHSVCPDKLLFDSEFHGLSTVHWRDPDMSPDYVRCIYWLAHLHGMGMNQTWYWGREADGAPKSKSGSGFYASNLTMPRVMNAYGRVMKELNAFAPEVVALATQPKRIRLFYSETAAIQDAEYMDRMYQTYRSLYHDGFPLGFVTERILQESHAKQLDEWPVVVVPHACYVTRAEIESLSKYRAQGGTLILIGANCLGHDPYGRSLDELPAGDAPLIQVNELSDPLVKATLADALRTRNLIPPIRLRETNGVGEPGCVWRTAEWKNGYLLAVINLGKSQADLAIGGGGSSCRDLIHNAPQPSRFSLRPFEVRLLHVDGDGGQ